MITAAWLLLPLQAVAATRGYTITSFDAIRVDAPVEVIITTGAGASAKVDIVDKKYARTYFGVTAAQAAASGLSVYDLKGGVRDVALSAKVTYALSERWNLQMLGGYKRLTGDFADSPLVKDGGSANQFSAAIAVGYRF